MSACPVGRQIVPGWLFFSHAVILNKNPHLCMATNENEILTSQKHPHNTWRSGLRDEGFYYQMPLLT